jgi:hypothetical protein
MLRRDLIVLVSGAAVWPLITRAQQAPKPPTIGYIGQSTAVAEAEAQRLLHLCSAPPRSRIKFQKAARKKCERPILYFAAD